LTSVRTLAKRGVGLGGRIARLFRHPSRRWALSMHEIGSHRWATSPSRFEAIVFAVCSHATVLALGDLLEAPDEGPLRVALTFDDGYLGVARHAVPILRNHGIRATVFLPTDVIQEDDAVPRQDRGLYPGIEVMGWRTVRRLAEEQALRFESHGAAHAPLPTLDDSARADDLRRSRDCIAVATGMPPTYLAYPFGAADAASARSAKEAGFGAALTTRHGGLRSGLDPFLLPRADIRSDYSPRDVLAILQGDWDFLAWSQRMRGRRP